MSKSSTRRWRRLCGADRTRVRWHLTSRVRKAPLAALWQGVQQMLHIGRQGDGALTLLDS